MKNKKMTGNNQHSLIKWKSFLIFDYMTGLVDEGRTVDITYLDFSKPFDTVSHKTFTEKLIKYGMSRQ